MTTRKVPATIPFSFPGLPGVRCLFSTRAAGDMSPADRPGAAAEAKENRRDFMGTAGFARWAELRQVHGDRLVPAKPGEGPDDIMAVEADGLFTREPGVGLVIQTADCQPILFAREDGGAVAAIHAGWRGNAADFPGKTVARLCEEFDCLPRHLMAVRGPSLGPAASEFINFHREWPAHFLPWFESVNRTVNLWRLTRHQLARAGVREERIFSLDLCTRTMKDLFFSHRGGDKGRQVSVIWRE